MALWVRLVIFGGLWTGLTAHSLSLWSFGLAAVPLALWASLRLMPPPPRRFHLGQFLRVLPEWLWLSLRGSLLVARAALAPVRADIQPRLRVFPVKLPDEHARLLMSAVVSLLPGTVCTAISRTHLTVHLLDDRMLDQAVTQLRRVEEQVWRIFGEKT